MPTTNNDTISIKPCTPQHSFDTLCHEEDAPTSLKEQQLCSTAKAAYVEGITGSFRTNRPSDNSGVLTILIISFLCVAFNFKHSKQLFKTFTQDLWSLRRRENAFDDHTANETRTLFVLIFQMCVYQGVLLFTKINSTITIPPDKIFYAFASLIGLTSIFYLLQLLAYTIIGNVFSDKIGATQWIKGFNASQLLLGFAIMIPALVSIFYPETVSMMFFIAMIFYFIARVIFICKGFRIFYHNFGSLLYFILYLCTLEIIPVILVYSGAHLLIDFLL